MGGGGELPRIIPGVNFYKNCTFCLAFEYGNQLIFLITAVVIIIIIIITDILHFAFSCYFHNTWKMHSRVTKRAAFVTPVHAK